MTKKTRSPAISEAGDGSRLPLALDSNPLLNPDDVKVIDLAELTGKMTLARPRQPHKRELIDMRRRENAKDAIRELTHENELYGFTKGQFSLLDLIAACLERTGPAHLSISTWTAARKEILEIDVLTKAGKIVGSRWLVDYTFVRRDRQAAHQIRQTFGTDSIRVANTHSKFCIFRNADWQLVIRSSMNLNMNPRFEDFTIAHDPEVAGFLTGILDEIWSKQSKTYGDTAKPGQNLADFKAGLFE